MDTWVLPNRGGLRDDLFIKNRKLTQNGNDGDDDGLFPHQRFVRLVMDPNSPYRGLVVFHGLGVGKTCTSIATAASVAPSVKRIIVFTRASLRSSYLREFESCGSTPLEVRSRFQFYAYNSSSGKEHDELVAAIQSDSHGFFKDTLVIVDEAHRFIARALSGASTNENGSVAYLAYKSLFYAGDSARLLLLTGTPIINSPFECATLLNLARGYAPVYRVHLETSKPEGGGAFEVAKELEKNDPYVESATAAKTMNTIDVVLVPRGFVKLANHPHRIVRIPDEQDNAAVNNTTSLIDRTSSKSEKDSIRDAFQGSRVEVLNLPLFPDDPSVFNETFVDNGQVRMIRRDLFMRRASGLVSYFNSRDESIYPVYKGLNVTVVDMSPWQYEAYDIIRSREIRKEQRRAQSESLSATYKAASRAVCNFAFPPAVLKTPSSVIGLGQGTAAMTSSTIAELVRGGYLSPVKLHEYSPKMHRIIEAVQTKPGIDLVYSQFRSLEGLGILAAAMKEYGMYEISILRQNREFVLRRSKGSSSGGDGKPETRIAFAVMSDDDEVNDMLINLINSRFGLLPPSIQEGIAEMFPGAINNTTGSIVKCLMITESGSEGISLKCCRRVHLLEPYWNNVRIDQVIGRAVRAHSHTDLPSEQRNVEAFLYTAAIPAANKETNFTIRWYDKGRSTDVIIHDIAERKQAITDDFAGALKGAAIDCGIWEPDPQQVTCMRDTPLLYNPSARVTEEAEADEFFQRKEETEQAPAVVFSNRIRADNGRLVLLQIEGTEDLADEDIYNKTGRVVIIARIIKSDSGSPPAITMLEQDAIFQQP